VEKKTYFILLIILIILCSGTVLYCISELVNLPEDEESAFIKNAIMICVIVILSIVTVVATFFMIREVCLKNEVFINEIQKKIQGKKIRVSSI
jgi:ATP/ADP translocase